VVLSDSQNPLFEGSNHNFPMQAASTHMAILPTVLMTLIKFVLLMLVHLCRLGIKVRLCIKVRLFGSGCAMARFSFAALHQDSSRASDSGQAFIAMQNRKLAICRRSTIQT